MKNLIYILSIFIISFCFTNCKNTVANTEETEEHQHDENEDASTATLTTEQAKSIGLETRVLEKKQLTASMKANGILKVPNQNRATATPFIGGVVKTISVQTGSGIRKGDVIATISNPSFVSMQEEYLSTDSKLVFAEQEFKRQEALHQGEATALKIVQQADSDVKTLRAKKASLKKQLEMIGLNTSSLTPENLQSTISILSPISGAVSNVMVNIGSYIDANNPVAEIIDNSQLHLDLFVYEKDLSKLKQGQTIHFTLTNNPGNEYDARIFGISNTFEQNTKAIAVHANVEGNKQGLIDGMSITAIVSLENALLDAVPNDAIVNYQNQDYIFIVKEDADHVHHEAASHDQKEGDHDEMMFEKIPVRKGTSDIGYTEITILTEIPTDAKIVTKGAFFILAKMTNQGEGHEH